MRTELLKIPGKGLCIVISGFDFVDGKIDISKLKNISNNFSDVGIIAELISYNQKIPAIKEVRAQTGWGLKEAKQYTDKYLPMSNRYTAVECHRASKRFIEDHTLEDFLDGDEFKI